MPAAWAEDLFRRIAIPRPAGSDAVAQVESEVGGRLAAFGYRVERQPFETGLERLRTVSLAAGGLAFWSVSLAPLLWIPLPPWAAAGAGWAVLATVVGIVWWLGRRGTGLPCISATNVVARRDEEPRLWLIAHVDSKAQRLSLRGRVVASTVLGVGVVGLALALAMRLAGPIPLAFAAPWSAVTAAAGLALSGAPLRGESPGAVDNASGMIAALVAAEALQERTDVGILFTGAEELGMEGARAWVRTGRAHGRFVNFDGIDGQGAFTLMVHRPGGLDAAGEISRTVRLALLDGGHEVRRSALPLGVFVDGSVLAAGGMAGITLSCGDWATLAAVHTRADACARTNVANAVAAGHAAAHAVSRLLG